MDTFCIKSLSHAQYMHTLSSSHPALEKDNGSWTKRLFICACCARSQHLSIYLCIQCTLNFFHILSCICGRYLSSNHFSGEVPSFKSSTFNNDLIYMWDILATPTCKWFVVYKFRKAKFISHASTKINLLLQLKFCEYLCSTGMFRSLH